MAQSIQLYLMVRLFFSVMIHCDIDCISSDSEEVVTFGWNEHGICGTGTESNVHSPYTISKPFEGRIVRLVGSGAGHSLVLANRAAKREN